MDEISKEINEAYMPLYVEDGCFYYFKGHNLDEEKIEHFLKEEYDDQFERLRFKETWAHWVLGTYNGEKQRQMLPDKKYKGVRGGFKITEVELIVA